jgi:hypothetical protein
MDFLFGGKSNNRGDVEFWHSPERCGWLMKQGGHMCIKRALRAVPDMAFNRRVYKNVEAEVTCMAARYLPTQAINACPCRWFILKQDKIFWFKSDVVTPVRVERIGANPYSA